MNYNIPMERYENTGYTEDPWDIINSYFRNQYLQKLVRHQLESYNVFVSEQIKKIFILNFMTF